LTYEVVDRFVFIFTDWFNTLFCWKLFRVNWGIAYLCCGKLFWKYIDAWLFMEGWIFWIFWIGCICYKISDLFSLWVMPWLKILSTVFSIIYKLNLLSASIFNMPMSNYQTCWLIPFLLTKPSLSSLLKYCSMFIPESIVVPCNISYNMTPIAQMSLFYEYWLSLYA